MLNKNEGPRNANAGRPYDPWPRAAGLAILTLGVILAGCSSDEAAKPDTASSSAPPAQQQQASAAESALVFGAQPGQPRFGAPSAGQSPPDVNTVPAVAPEPRSTKEERTKAIEGLIADRANARHSDQAARTMPVEVRPLSDVLPPAPQADLAPPAQPRAAPAASVQRLETPAPARPAEAGDDAAAAPVPLPVPPPPRTAAVSGPRPQSAMPQASIADNGSDSRAATISATSAGFRSLATFNAGSYRTTTQVAAVDVPSGGLTANERSALSGAALKQAETKGVIRVLAHGRGNVRAGLERATTVARELERLGVPSDRLYVGADAANGTTEVHLHY